MVHSCLIRKNEKEREKKILQWLATLSLISDSGRSLPMWVDSSINKQHQISGTITQHENIKCVPFFLQLRFLVRFHSAWDKMSMCDAEWNVCVYLTLWRQWSEVNNLWILFWQVDDVIISRLGTCTEEGKKVQRNGGKNFLAVFRRIEDSN